VILEIWKALLYRLRCRPRTCNLTLHIILVNYHLSLSLSLGSFLLIDGMLHISSLRLPAALLVGLRQRPHSSYPFSDLDRLMTFNLMILECSGGREWRILAVRVQAPKTLGVSSLMLKSKFVGIESSRGSRARGRTASVCGGTKLSLEELELLSRHSREILDKEERFDVCLVICENVGQFFDLL
jgi:hypothetical protein